MVDWDNEIKKIDKNSTPIPCGDTLDTALGDETTLGRSRDCPLCAYAVRRIALEEESCDNEIKRRAQLAWLRLCVKPEGDFVMMSLSKYVNREEDVLNIVEKAIKPERGLIGEGLMPGGKYYYYRTLFLWFLRRYNWRYAKEMFDKIEYPNWWAEALDGINLCYPRLLVSILIGFLPLVMGQEMWNLSLKLNFISFSVIVMFSIFLSLGYLCVECYGTMPEVEGMWVILKRALFVFLIGLIYSLFGSLIICSIHGKVWISEEFTENYFYLGFMKNVLFFAVMALFIGVFIQNFWEEKPVTEGL